MLRKLSFLALLCMSLPPAAAAQSPALKSFPPADLKEADPSSEVVFVVAGDNRGTAQGAPLPRVLDTIFSEIALIRPDFILWTGDTVYGYGDSEANLDAEYGEFERVAANRLKGRIPLYNAPGNHEIHNDAQPCKDATGKAKPSDPKHPPLACSETKYSDRFGALYGSFDHAGAHFISLDTDVATSVKADTNGIFGPQMTWLQGDLERHKGARAIFVFSHTEFYSSPRIDTAQGDSHPPIPNRQELQALFQQYPVRAVFSGHEHIFWHEPAEQHNGIEYFVAGGAGAPLYASPDRGGFSHYMVVRLSGNNKVTYQLIEPGRLYVEDNRCQRGRAPLPEECPEAGKEPFWTFWIVNSNDMIADPTCAKAPEQALALRGLDVAVPTDLGACADLTATAQVRYRSGWTSLDGFAIDCAASSGGTIHFTAPPLGQGSALVTVRRKTQS